MALKKISRAHSIIILVCVCLLEQMTISHKLWYPSGREFPLIRAFNFLPVSYGLVTDGILSGVAMVCLIALCFRPFNKWVVLLVTVIFSLLVLEDITRLQPWLYLFTIIILTVSLLGEVKQDLILAAIRFILAATYFWSGLQKLNHAFSVDVFPWLMSPLGLKGFLVTHHRIAYAIPIIELLAGLCLLSRRLQKPAGVLLIVIHLILVYTLGPWGNNWNTVVWPWNLAMAAIIAIIITHRGYVGVKIYRELLTKNKWYSLVIILVSVMPAFNYAGLWDNYLSNSLYSGTIPQAVFYFDADNKLPVSVNTTGLYYPEQKGEYFLIDGWALEELNAPLYPEERYFKKIATILCAKEKDKSKAGLLIIKHKKFTAELYQENCKCDSLAKTP